MRLKGAKIDSSKISIEKIQHYLNWRYKKCIQSELKSGGAMLEFTDNFKKWHHIIFRLNPSARGGYEIDFSDKGAELALMGVIFIMLPELCN